jgi:hypothetical protein
MAAGAPFIQRTSVADTVRATPMRNREPTSEHPMRLVALHFPKLMPQQSKNHLHELKAGDPKNPAG